MIKPLCLCALVFLVVYAGKSVNELSGDYLKGLRFTHYGEGIILDMVTMSSR